MQLVLQVHRIAELNAPANSYISLCACIICTLLSCMLYCSKSQSGKMHPSLPMARWQGFSSSCVSGLFGI